jgi:signal transduction histidine kinase
MDDGRLMFAFAHDIRAHLRTVLTRIQLVQRSGSSTLSDEDRLMLGETVTAVAAIGSLVDAMSAYCDVNAGNSVMNLRLVLRGILIELKAPLADSGAVVEGSTDLDVPVPTGLQIVLKELLTNACKFRDRSRPLRIHISTGLGSDGILEIAVSDNGIGVPQEYLERIFVPFQRLHSRDEFAGNGLGLATCRRIAAAWGGEVIAEAGSDGGLVIRVTVPGTQSI